MDFIKLKYIFIIALAAPPIYLVSSNKSSIFSRPDIKDINIPSINDFKFEAKENLSQENPNDINEIKSFDYKVIGYRAGINDSSVILKKGNKEYFVSQGEKLEGIYELIEVNQNEIIFRENEKLYRINNLVGK
jgi:type II secretory pathway component PulC